MSAINNPCKCGCGKQAKVHPPREVVVAYDRPASNFLQGHDKRVAGQLDRLSGRSRFPARPGDHVPPVLVEHCRAHPEFTLYGFTAAEIIDLASKEA